MLEFDLSDAIEMVACSDTRRVRRNNEDAIFVNPRLGLAILADGMGGHNAGEVASNMVITALGSELDHAFRKLPPWLPVENHRSRAHGVLPGDVYLPCLDGLNDMAEDNEIAAILPAFSDVIELGKYRLKYIKEANQAGGREDGVLPARLMPQPFQPDP